MDTAGLLPVPEETGWRLSDREVRQAPTIQPATGSSVPRSAALLGASHGDLNGTVASCSSCFRMLSDDNKAQIKTIEAHLRRLGLTEEQIALHLTPLRSKAEKPQPIRQKAGTSSAAVTYFMRPSRKPQLAGDW
jgi:hypothetical protein